jgi:hypothetical protein
MQLSAGICCGHVRVASLRGIKFHNDLIKMKGYYGRRETYHHPKKARDQNPTRTWGMPPEMLPRKQ